MVRINRVYTRKGDGGNTSLVGGSTISKDHLRVESYGTVDELNSVLGIVRTHITGKDGDPHRQGFDKILRVIQQRLFDLGAELATAPDENGPGVPVIGSDDVKWLEEVIDTMNSELPPLESFILPGGGPLAAFLHQARTVCRRCERVVVALSRQEQVGKRAVAYLNRLSDALFVFSRWTAARLGEPETLWEPGLKPDDSWRW